MTAPVALGSSIFCGHVISAHALPPIRRPRLCAELALLKSALTVQELQDRIAERQRESEEVRAKLARARESEEAEVSAEDLEAAEKAFSKGVQTWERLRKIFRNIWDTVRENVDANQVSCWSEELERCMSQRLAGFQNSGCLIILGCARGRFRSAASHSASHSLSILGCTGGPV